jgi:hypothetical protein
MRTTVTLDPDTEHLLQEKVRRSGKSFKQTLNDAIRRGIRPEKNVRVSASPLFEKPFPKELESLSFNRLADEWDDEETIRELSR